jgi:hypothetical protein
MHPRHFSTNDQKAVDFVTEQAAAGSAYHQEAIRLNGTAIHYDEVDHDL